MAKAISVEGALAHYSSGRLASAYINAWNVGARFSLLPFGVIHSRKVLHDWLDGAFEVGLEPTFQRFNSVHQNFAGVLLELRYYLVRLRYGPFVPWMGGAIGPRLLGPERLSPRPRQQTERPLHGPHQGRGGCLMAYR
jgi:hypothetical protein